MSGLGHRSIAQDRIPHGIWPSFGTVPSTASPEFSPQRSDVAVPG